MTTAELARAVRFLEITTRKAVTATFAGRYTSAFKGRGMEFDEVREYQSGDDVRTIDWNVSARTWRLHTKRYVEEPGTPPPGASARRTGPAGPR